MIFKKLTSAFLIVLLPLFVLCQTGETFTIIKVKGEILNKTTGGKLVAGNIINASDQLEFATTGAEAVAISSSRGKFVIKLPPSDLFGDTEALAYANTAASPVSMRAQYSVRALDPRIDDLAQYLGSETFYIIGETVEMKFSESAYPLSAERFFSLSYMVNGQEVTVDINGQGQTVNFSQSLYFTPYTTNPTVSAVNFYDLNAKQGSINHVATVDISFLSETELMSELTILYQALQKHGMERKEMRTYIKQYFSDVYGKTDPAPLAALISKVMEP